MFEASERKRMIVREGEKVKSGGEGVGREGY